jgi:putative thioredoxin
MATVRAVDVTDATFEQDVVARSAEVPVVVDFWADWCGPCKALAPVLEREAEARDGRVVLAKVDVDSNPEVAQRYGIRGIPAVKAFRNGHVVREFTGAQSPQTVAAFLDALTAPSEADALVAELREAGGSEAALAALDAGDHERAFELLLEEVADAEPERRERLRRLLVALFADFGQEHPLVARSRRRLATLLY